MLHYSTNHFSPHASPYAALEALRTVGDTVHQSAEIGGALIGMATAMSGLWGSAAEKFTQRTWGIPSAMLKMAGRATQRFEKPAFGITETKLPDGQVIPIREEVAWSDTWCKLVHFKRDDPMNADGALPKVMVVAPMSGYYATLLRGHVEGLLPKHDVYVTDWENARDVPLSAGTFDADDYVHYLMRMMRFFKGDAHVIGVCQPAPLVMAAVSLMEAAPDPHVPRSMVLIAGPIDTRISPTEVNKLATEKGIEWFEKNVIDQVPFPYAGFGRSVYPGFVQCAAFVAMNPDRHTKAHRDMFIDMAKGDDKAVKKSENFYNEYFSVMDMTAEYYLQTLLRGFIEHHLPRGIMEVCGVKVDPSAIRRVGLMTVEGKDDDITGVGQCGAAHKLCSNLAPSMKQHHLQPGVGHYGAFNGRRFLTEILPAIEAFIVKHQRRPHTLSAHIINAARPVGHSALAH